MWNWIKKFLGFGETSTTVEQVIVTTEPVPSKPSALEGEIVQVADEMPLTIRELDVALKAMKPGEEKTFYLVDDPDHPDIQMVIMFATMHHGKTIFQDLDYDRRCIEVRLSAK